MRGADGADAGVSVRGNDPENYFSDVRPGFHESMRFRRRRERKGCVNDRPHLAALNERLDFLVHRASDGALFLDTART